MDASHVSLIVLALTAAGRLNWRQRLETGPRCEEGLPFCSVAVASLSECGFDPKLLSRSHEGMLGLAPVSFKCVCVFLFSPFLFFAPEGECWRRGGGLSAHKDMICCCTCVHGSTPDKSQTSKSLSLTSSQPTTSAPHAVELLCRIVGGLYESSVCIKEASCGEACCLRSR